MIAKDQHKVPQFYLKRFAISGKKSIFVFNKRTQIIKPRKIKRVACEKYFYDYPEKFIPKGQTKQECETRLSRLEDRAKLMFDMILNYANKKEEIPSANIGSMAVYITIQILRGQRNRDKLIDISKSTETLDLRHRDILLTEYGESYHEDFAAYVNIQTLTNTYYSIDKIFPELSNRFKWLIGINNTNLPLYTSDEPVVNNANKETAYIGEWKIMEAGKAIYFPISPKFVIILEDRHYYVPCYTDRWEFQELDETMVEYLNTLQVAQSYNQVFSNINRFELAYKYMKKFHSEDI
jgi:hypothetical protein